MTKIAIIGAGLSALTAAHYLKNNAQITLFEKARGVSGRMATRRAEPYYFDHGAQFFKVRTAEFKEFIAPMIADGAVGIWHGRFAEIDTQHITNTRIWDNTQPHYVGTPGMNAIGRYMADKLTKNGVTIHLNTEIATISKDADLWHLYDKNGNDCGHYDWLISTIPPAQAHHLLPPSLPYHDILQSVKMKGCFSLMLGFADALNLPFDSALVRNRDISWISVNSTKPSRNSPYCLLVHSTNDWADAHIDDDKDSALNYLCQHTSEVIGQDVSKATHQDIHKWRYANIEKQEGNDYIMDNTQKIGICGDWLISGRVESAFTSALHLSQNIITELSHKNE